MKIFFGLVFTVAGTAAVSAPIVLNSGGSSRVKRDFSSRKVSSGGGDIQISVSKCENSGGEKIDFGSSLEGYVCGYADSLAGSNDFEEGTDLFQKEGKGESVDGNKEKGRNQGTKSCLDDGITSQGSIMTQSYSGVKYLGFCAESNKNHTKFVKKVKTNVIEDEKEALKFGVCSQDCGERDTSVIAMSAQVLENENKNNGKEVSFYKNKLNS